MEICLNAHEEYLKEMDNEELNEDYRQYCQFMFAIFEEENEKHKNQR